MTDDDWQHWDVPEVTRRARLTLDFKADVKPARVDRFVIWRFSCACSR